ncbi:hypothetical protein DAQ1742_02802 [Dickeya aquatica]|uniref:Uncharacterized protein n=1 Tax=Dickeya aquatica TaxID=1401087 RepID=A0A375ACA1_9GAMM|nr:hypothetical protein DAQ1742_02802 [Dickeya aquatica]
MRIDNIALFLACSNVTVSVRRKAMGGCSPHFPVATGINRWFSGD